MVNTMASTCKCGNFRIYFFKCDNLNPFFQKKILYIIHNILMFLAKLQKFSKKEKTYFDIGGL
jgi:hypothetical protein